MNQFLTTDDGLRLHLQEWPDARPVRGTVLMVHGFGEHIGRYAYVAAHLNAWGYRAIGYDHRGHGRSEGPKGRLMHADDWMRDLALAIDAVRAAHPGPLWLLGHSMGGLICARFVAEGVADGTPATWHRQVDGLVLSSPALDLGLSLFERFKAALVGSIAPHFAVGNGRATRWLSRDPKVIAAFDADPLVHDRISSTFVNAMLSSGHVVRERAASWSLPTLLMFAGSDRAVSPAGSRHFADAAPKNVVTTHEFPAMFHEIFNEPEKHEVFTALGAWLAAQPT